MEKQRRITKQKKTRITSKTEEQEVIKFLLDEGAVEIPRSDWNKERYKTLMKNIKRKGKFVCD